MSTLSVLSIVTDSWKNLEIWKGGKKLPALCALSLKDITGCTLKGDYHINRLKRAGKITPEGIIKSYKQL